MASEKNKLVDNTIDSKEFRESYIHNRSESQNAAPTG